MKKIVHLLSVFTSVILFAQNAGNISNYTPFIKVLGGSVEIDFRYYNVAEGYNPSNTKKIFSEKELEDIEGTPFIYKDFVKARIQGISGSFEIRYNALQDQINLKLADGIYLLTKEKPFTEIRIENSNSIIKLVNYSEKNNTITGYLFEIFKKDNVSLFEKRAMVYKDETVARNSYGTTIPARFEELPLKFFITTQDGKIVELPKSPKELLQLFPEKAQKISDFEKNRRINLKDKESIKELIRNF